MEIKSVEVQSLLLQLMQVLKPLAEGEIIQKKEQPDLASRIFVPPPSLLPRYKFAPLRPEVSVLPVLQTAQKQMKQWVPPAKNNKPPLEKTAASPPKSALSSDSPSSLVAQAKQTLTQVRIAIQLLSSFANLNKPEEKTLRETLSRLKPLIDDLIEVVRRKETVSLETRSPPSLRPLPTSPREHLLKKLPTFSTLQKTKQESPPTTSPSSSKASSKPQEMPPPPKIYLPQADKKLFKFSDPTSISSAPYSSEKARLSKPLKKKKKKNFLWPEPEDLTSER